MFDDFGGRVAEALGSQAIAQLSSAATLCAGAVVPAISAVLQGRCAAGGVIEPVADHTGGRRARSSPRDRRGMRLS